MEPQSLQGLQDIEYARKEKTFKALLLQTPLQASFRSLQTLDRDAEG